MKNLYEQFHHNRKIEKKVINGHDFTYRTLIRLINKYLYQIDDVLDIGCGVGSVDFYLCKIGKKVTGVDVSKNAIQVAKRNSAHLGFMNKIDFRIQNVTEETIDHKFSLVICSEVLEHLYDDKKVVHKIKNNLKDGGLVFASSPTTKAPLYRLGLLNCFDKEVGHLRRYSVMEYEDLFLKEGLKVLEVVKTEGIIRNFLFTNKIGGLLLRLFNKRPLSYLINVIDDLSIFLFGESNVYVVARK